MDPGGDMGTRVSFVPVTFASSAAGARAARTSVDLRNWRLDSSTAWVWLFLGARPKLMAFCLQDSMQSKQSTQRE